MLKAEESCQLLPLADRLADYIQEHHVPYDTEKNKKRDTDISPKASGFGGLLVFDAIVFPQLHSLPKTFSEVVVELLQKKHIKASDMYRRAGITKDHFSKIKNNADYHPSKATAMALALAMQLTPEEADDLLQRAGYTFSPSLLRDLIIKFFIDEGIYNMDEVNLQLHAHGIPPLTGTKNYK
ncbi:MAG: helix-turn-helix domain-containing protein [Anaerovibrio sp.]